MNEQLLEEIGLTKGEIKVYLTLLKLGETTTGKIVEQAQISSGKIYEILEKLIKKGLASFIIKEKTKYFSAASPNRILDFLSEKEKKIKIQEEQLQKELPALLTISKEAKKKYETKLFIGFKGYQTAIFEALVELKPESEFLAMGIQSRRSEKFNLLWQKWNTERIKKKIKCKLLFSEKGTEHYNIFKKMKLTEVKTIKGITPAAADVMGDKVLILSHGTEPSVLVIKHPDIKESFTTFFNNLWQIAKK
ncbi:hypothetical protein HY483_00935 [Candidatus Woesearchaeota archaeon]|nr:hypothetical protein [Candidatus Woesearchaeota archaeon]